MPGLTGGRDPVRGGWPRTGHGRQLALLGGLAALGLLLVTVTTSAPPGRPPGSDAPAAAGATVSVDGLWRLPPIYDLVYAVDEKDVRVAAAHLELIRRCMARRGFEYRAPAPPTGSSADDRPAPFGLESLPPPDRQKPDHQKADAPPPADADGTGEAFYRALAGDEDRKITVRGKRLAIDFPTSGCIADAEQELLGDGRVRWKELRLILYEAERDVQAELLQDIGIWAVNFRWRACVRRSGFDHSDPAQLLAALPEGTDLSRDPRAIADVRCKAETGYLRIGYPRLAQRQRDWLDRNPQVLPDWIALRERQRRAAERLLDGRPEPAG